MELVIICLCSALSCLGIAASLFMLVRNDWVYSVRIEWINSGMNPDSVCSYSDMMLRWWSWKRDMEDWK